MRTNRSDNIFRVISIAQTRGNKFWLTLNTPKLSYLIFHYLSRCLARMGIYWILCFKPLSKFNLLLFIGEPKYWKIRLKGLWQYYYAKQEFPHGLAVGICERQAETSQGFLGVGRLFEHSGKSFTWRNGVDSTVMIFQAQKNRQTTEAKNLTYFPNHCSFPRQTKVQYEIILPY